MEKGSGNKAKIICLFLVMVFGIGMIVLGCWQMRLHTSCVTACTATTEGMVVYEGKGKLDHLDQNVHRYVSSEYWRHIEVATDDTFRLTDVYANRGPEHEGDSILIHYDPKDSDVYYIGDTVGSYRAVAVTAFVAAGVMLLLAVVIVIAIARPQKAVDRHIHLDKPHG